MLKLLVVLIVSVVVAQDALFKDSEHLIPNFKNPAPLPDTFFDEDLAEEMQEMKSCNDKTTKRTTREITITTPYTESTTKSTTERTTTEGPDTGDLCLSKTCIKTAADLIRSMNKTVDPCDDFFEYACGSWAKHNFIPWNSGEYGTFSKLRDDVFYKTMDLIQIRELRSDPEAVKKAKRSFQSCMNENLIDTLQGKPLTDLLTRMGGFPVLENNFDESNFDYLELMAKMNLAGFQSLFQHGVWSGYKDPQNYYFQLDQTKLNMKREYFLKPQFDNYMTLYRNFAHEMAMELGARNTLDTKKQMNDMIDFEVELAKINAPPSERQNWDKIYKKLTMDEFRREVTSGLDLEKYINSLLRGVGRPRMSSNFKVINWSTPKFFRAFVALINRTPKKTVANYMMFNFVYNTCGYLSPSKFGDIISRFVKPIWGSSGNYARANTCSWTVGQGMGWATGRMFVDGFFDKGAKSAASVMIDSIRETFEGMMKKLTWMDRKSRNTAVEKAEAIVKMIGYPDDIIVDRKLNKIYSRMVMKKDTYYNNYLSLWASTAYDEIKNIGTVVNKHDYSSWIVMPTVVNAFYSPTANSISFPAAILQPPFYHKDHPKYLNYAGIGYVMGHELTHGFDNSGKEYDLHGKHRQWWPKDVIRKYTQKAQCFVEQYNNYYVPEVKRYVDGKLTLNENLADNGGILESFTAYRKYVAQLGHEEKSLPGLNLSNNQLFYLNAAQVWCGKVFTGRAWNWDLKEVHSPGRYRVWGSVSNSEDFAKTYKCARGSKMNPVKKCALWV